MSREISDKEIKEQTYIDVPNNLCPKFLGHLSPQDLSIRIAVNYFPKSSTIVNIIKCPEILLDAEEKLRKIGRYEDYMEHSLKIISHIDIERINDNIVKALCLMAYHYNFLTQETF